MQFIMQRARDEDPRTTEVKIIPTVTQNAHLSTGLLTSLASSESERKLGITGVEADSMLAIRFQDNDGDVARSPSEIPVSGVRHARTNASTGRKRANGNRMAVGENLLKAHFAVAGAVAAAVAMRRRALLRKRDSICHRIPSESMEENIMNTAANSESLIRNEEAEFKERRKERRKMTLERRGAPCRGACSPSGRLSS